MQAAPEVRANAPDKVRDLIVRSILRRHGVEDIDLERLLDEGDPATQPNYRAVLGVAADAGLEEIKRAYRVQVGQWHPDRLDGTAPELQRAANEHMMRLNEAYQALSQRVG